MNNQIPAEAKTEEPINDLAMARAEVASIVDEIGFAIACLKLKTIDDSAKVSFARERLSEYGSRLIKLHHSLL